MFPRSARSLANAPLREAGRCLALASILGLLALAAGTGCYRPQVTAGRKPPARLVGIADGAWLRVAGMRLHVFNTGMNRVSPLLVGSPAPWRPVPAFVIEHPSRGLLLFDCGLGREIAEKGEGALHPLTRLLFKTRSVAGRDLPSQMREAGLEPQAVALVIFSHLHFDHVGTAEAFPHARFVVGSGERAAAGSRVNGFEPRHTAWIPQDAWRIIDFSRGRPYATFDRTVDLLGDGSVILVSGGGHTRGGMGALLHLPAGPVMLAGDLVVHRDWLAGDDVQRIVVDVTRAADVRNRIRMLVRLVPKLVLFPGHDLPEIRRQRRDVVIHHPEFFSPEAWPLQ